MAGYVKVRLRRDGQIEAVTEGIKGKRCTQYIKILEELLDARAVDSAYTHEFYETADVTAFEGQNERIEGRE